MSSHSKARALKFVSTLVLILPMTALGAEWSATGSLNPAVTYDDNVFMAEDKQSSLKYTVTPTLNLSRTQDDNSQTLSLGYVGQRYSSLSYLNQQYPFARFSSSFQAERSSWGVTASYVERSSRSYAEEDTGDFTTETTVRTESFSPSYNYKLTERDSISVNANYSHTSTSNTTDSERISFTSGWSRQFTERLNGGLNISATNFQSTSGMTDTTDDYTYGVNTSLSYGLSELWKLNGSIGVSQLDSNKNNNNIVQKNSNSNLSLNMSVTKNTGLGALSLNVSRSLTQSISGDVNTADRLSFSWSRSITERLSTSFSSSYQETSSATEETNVKRKNLSLSPAVSWSVDPNLALSLAYNFRQQKSVATDPDVNSNSLTLRLNYTWDGFSVSR